jgi:serine/threonine protein kinase
MDLMREGNLRQYLAGRGWNQQRGKELLLDVSEGMIYLHSLGILHGDLKSLNVLVDGSRAVITDFGLSKLLFEVSRSLRANTQHVAGTPNFSSPELLNGAMIQPPADVYAFGMVAYEIVSKGLYPYGDKPNLGAIVFSVVVKQETPERPEGVEDEMWALMKRTWSYEASERPDFVKVRDDLEKLV